LNIFVVMNIVTSTSL